MSRVPMLPDYGGAIGRVNWQNALSEMAQKQALAQQQQAEAKFAPQYFQGQANLEQGIGGIEQANALVAPQQAQANLAVTQSTPAVNQAQANSLNQGAAIAPINSLSDMIKNNPVKFWILYNKYPQFKAWADQALMSSTNSLKNAPAMTGATPAPASTSIINKGRATAPGPAQGQPVFSGAQGSQPSQANTPINLSQLTPYQISLLKKGQILTGVDGYNYRINPSTGKLEKKMPV